MRVRSPSKQASTRPRRALLGLKSAIEYRQNGMNSSSSSSSHTCIGRQAGSNRAARESVAVKGAGSGHSTGMAWCRLPATSVDSTL
jgi:hypothetical protein